MVTKISIYVDAIHQGFIAIYIENDGTFKFGPFSLKIEDLAKVLAEELYKKNSNEEDQDHIIFPKETLVIRAYKPGEPSVYFFEKIEDCDLKHDFFSSFQKTDLDLRIGKTKIPA